MKDILISDLANEYFQKAFKLYFNELEVKVENWNELFQEINDDKDNFAYIRLTEDFEVVGFIQFKCIELSNWFFTAPFGFIREFWVSSEYRGKGQGKELLFLAEEYFKNKNIVKCILTTDGATEFYEKHGYKHDKTIIAENKDAVYVKILK